MPFDYRLPLFSGLAGAGVIYVIFLMPPLTSTSSSGSAEGTSEAALEVTLAAERAFCRSQPEAVNCECFAKRAGAVISHTSSQIPGAVYANKQALARGQAVRGC